MMNKKVKCFICNDTTEHSYIVTRGDGEKLIKCSRCNTIRVEDIDGVINKTAYNSDYFNNDGGMGYANYLTSKLKSIIKNEFDPYVITKKIISKEFKYKKKVNILEVGCAYGLFNLIADDTFNYRGIDINEDAIKSAKNIFNFQNLTSENLLEINETFDVIFMLDVIEHIKEPSALLSVIYNLLNNDGILILSTPNAEIIEINKNWIGINASYEHLYYFTELSLGTLLKNNKFMPTFQQFDFYKSKDTNFIKLLVKKILSLIFKKYKLKHQLFAVARKSL